MVEKASICNFGRDQLFIHCWDRQELWFSVEKRREYSSYIPKKLKDNKGAQGYKSMIKCKVKLSVFILTPSK